MIHCQRCVEHGCKVVPATHVICINLPHGHKQEIVCADHRDQAIEHYGTFQVDEAELVPAHTLA